MNIADVRQPEELRQKQGNRFHIREMAKIEKIRENKMIFNLFP